MQKPITVTVSAKHLAEVIGQLHLWHEHDYRDNGVHCHVCNLIQQLRDSMVINK